MFEIWVKNRDKSIEIVTVADDEEREKIYTILEQLENDNSVGSIKMYNRCGEVAHQVYSHSNRVIGFN